MVSASPSSLHGGGGGNIGGNFGSWRPCLRSRSSAAADDFATAADEAIVAVDIACVHGDLADSRATFDREVDEAERQIDVLRTRVARLHLIFDDDGVAGAAVEYIRSLQTMLDNARAAWPDVDDIAHGVAHLMTQGKLGLFVFSAREEIRPPGLRRSARDGGYAIVSCRQPVHDGAEVDRLAVASRAATARAWSQSR